MADNPSNPIDNRCVNGRPTKEQKCTSNSDKRLSGSVPKKSKTRVQIPPYFRYENESKNYIKINTNILALCLEGSPRAYHPNDEGIDYNENAGIEIEDLKINGKLSKNGPFIKGKSEKIPYGIALREIKQKGIPTGTYYAYIQGDDGIGPNPGYYVSTTALHYFGKKEYDTTCHVNSEEIPFIVCRDAFKGIKKGDIAYVQNNDNNLSSFAIFGDYKKTGQVAEISLKLAANLGIKVITTDTKNPNPDNTILTDVKKGKKAYTYAKPKNEVFKYIAVSEASLTLYCFKGSRDGHAKTLGDIIEIGKKCFDIIWRSPGGSQGVLS